ncbi:MAG: GNAT family N-acetyltransferase [Micrococcales bacterium]|nr:GNAT family N-acetyltransferase [Micrococcales bacterium]
MIRAREEVRFRSAREQDLDALIAIHFAAFPDGRGREARRRNFCDNPRGSLDNLHVAEASGRLVAHGFLFDLQAWVGGRALGVGGIASIGVAPEARRTGVAHALLGHMLQKMHGHGLPLSMLYPFRHDFYRQLGWGLTSAMHRFRVQPASLPSFPERGRVRAAEPTDMGAVRRCYERWAGVRTGLLVRSDEVWQAILSPDLVRVAVVPSEGTPNALDGFLAYRLMPEVGTQVVELEVIELVAVTEAARFALIGFLSAQRDQITRVQITVPPDELLLPLLSDPRAPSGELVRGLLMPSADLLVGAMTRIVSLPAALASRGWAGRDGQIALCMDDTWLPGNAQPFTLRIASHAAEVTPGRRDGVPLLEADPAVMAQIYMGHLTPSQAVASRLARIDPADALPDADALLVTRPAFTLDVF